MKVIQGNLLGLSSAESGILDVLRGGKRFSVSEIARRSTLPRTTVTAALERLKDRGMLTSRQTAYRTFWSIREDQLLEKEFDESLEHLLEEDSDAPAVSREKILKKGEIREVRGIEELLKVYLWIILNHRNEEINLYYGPGCSQAVLLDAFGAEKMAQIKANIELAGARLVERALPHLPPNTSVFVVSRGTFYIDWNKKSMLIVRNQALNALFRSAAGSFV